MFTVLGSYVEPDGTAGFGSVAFAPQLGTGAWGVATVVPIVGGALATALAPGYYRVTESVGPISRPPFIISLRADTNLTIATPGARSRTVWAVGDSLTIGTPAGAGQLLVNPSVPAYNTAWPTGQPLMIYQYGAWETWALLASEARWTFGGVFATAGRTAAGMLANEVPACVAAARIGDTVVVLAGTNGLVLADVIAVHNTLRSAGLRTIAVTIPPNSSTPAASVIFNEGLKLWAASSGTVLADVHTVLVDRVTGAYAAAFAADGTHPNEAGYAIMGQTIAASLNTFWAPLVLADTQVALAAGQRLGCAKPLALGSPTLGVDYTVFVTGGTSTVAPTAVAGFVGGQGYTASRLTDDIIFALTPAITLIPGHTIRLGLSFSATIAAGGSIAANIQSNATNQMIFSIGGNPGLHVSAPFGRCYIEFVVPVLPDYNYYAPGFFVLGASGTTLSVGEVTALDLTAMGFA